MVAILLIAVVFMTSFVVDAALSIDDRVAALNMHNQVRATVSPPALNMLALNWDPNLEASAQAYANTCPTGHSSTPYGENLAWGWPVMNITDGISAWASENQWYDISKLACASGKVCGHYTQMVWATTELVGCGHATCPGLFGRDQVQVYVCHYSSPGNWAGMSPYAVGTACGWCPVGYGCTADKLCAKIGTFIAPSTTPPVPFTRRPRPAAETSSPITYTPVPSTSPSAPTSSPSTLPTSVPSTPIPTTSSPAVNLTASPSPISPISTSSPSTIPTTSATSSPSSAPISPIPTSSLLADTPSPTVTVVFNSPSSQPNSISPAATSTPATLSPTMSPNSSLTDTLLSSVVSTVANQLQNSTSDTKETVAIAILSSQATSAPSLEDSTTHTPRPRRISIV